MFRTAIIAIATAATLGSAVAEPASPTPAARIAEAVPAGQWAVVRAGDRTVSQCVMGLRSDLAAPQPGRPQFMIAADNDFAVLRVRAAEWSFSAGRAVAVTLVTADGTELSPAADVRGADLIDIAFGKAAERVSALGGSGHLDIRTEGGTVRLPLKGLPEVLPAFRNCIASIGQPNTGLHASAAFDRR